MRIGDLPPVMVRERLRAQLAALSRGSYVVRFHTRPQVQPQNVGHHTYGVIYLCWVLYGGKPSAALITRAITHDTPEFKTGDVPGPVKSANALRPMEEAVLAQAFLPTPPLTDDEERVLRLADLLEGMRHCVYERQLGNQLIRTCYERYKDKAEEFCKRPHENFIWQELDQQWEKANASK